MVTKPLDEASLKEVKSQIKYVLEERYDQIDPSIMDDFAKMAVYLRDATETEITECFKPLSDELEARYVKLGMIEEIKNPDGSTTKKVIASPSAIPPHNVFTSVIEDWAKENGFNQATQAHCIVNQDEKQVRKLIDLPNKIPTIFGVLPIHAFRSLLSSGYLFKDPGAGKEHGEVTHLLTIYFLYEANKKNPFLTHDFVELYKMLGNEQCFHPKKPTPPVSVWDILFDKPVGSSLNTPQGFNKFLREKIPDIKQTQVLSSFVNVRFSKRSKVEKEYASEKSGKLAAKKFGNAPGLLLDGKIFFSLPYTASQCRATYDEVTDTCHYDLQLKDKFSLPNKNINQDLPLIDQIITLFDTKQWDSAHSNAHTKELADQIHEQFLQIKNEVGENNYVSHRLIAETLEALMLSETKITLERFGRIATKQDSIYRDDEYIQFLVNESKGMLLEHDKKDLQETKTQTNELYETGLRLRGG